MNTTPNFQGTYCDKTFVYENAFIKHKCEMMQRSDEIRTPIGQAAWLYYQKWMKVHKKSVTNIEQFVSSKRFFRTFMRFAEFAERVNLIDIDAFVRMTKDKKYQPSLWTNDEVYSQYLEYLDHNTSPKELAEKTFTFIQQIAKVMECKVEDTFDQLQPGDIMQFIRERKFTPWVLLRSKKFKQYLISLDEDERNQFTYLIKPKYWEYKFSQNPTIVSWMDTKVRELNI